LTFQFQPLFSYSVTALSSLDLKARAAVWDLLTGDALICSIGMRRCGIESGTRQGAASGRETEKRNDKETQKSNYKKTEMIDLELFNIHDVT
jgi:hypothetical protein